MEVNLAVAVRVSSTRCYVLAVEGLLGADKDGTLVLPDVTGRVATRPPRGALVLDRRRRVRRDALPARRDTDKRVTVTPEA